MKPINFRTIRNGKIARIIAAFLAVNILAEMLSPTLLYALTSGPAQEETSGFESSGTSNMVDVFSGDFTYNIPLFNVPGPNGGYPINLAYHSGPGMEQEASWVGLGWSLNVGAVTRQLRSLPDDFKGETISQEMALKSNNTVSMKIPTQPQKELMGVHMLSLAPHVLTFYHNSYKGVGYNISTQSSQPNPPAGISVGLNFDSQNGIGKDVTFSLAHDFGLFSSSFEFHASMNSRKGLTSLSFTNSLSKGILGVGTGFSAQSSYGIPSVQVPMKNVTNSFDIEPGGSLAFGDFNVDFPIKGSVYTSSVKDNGIVENAAYGYLYTTEAPDEFALKDFQRQYLPYSRKVPNLAPSAFTYDIYTQTGQGASTAFRPFLSGVGILADPQIKSTEWEYDGNYEFGASASGTSFHAGVGMILKRGSHTSGGWTLTENGASTDNELDGVLDFKAPNTHQYETSYFQAFGEKSTMFVPDDQLAAFKNNKPVKVKLEKVSTPNWLNRQYIAKNKFVTSETDLSPEVITQQEAVRKKSRRVTNIYQLTDGDAVSHGITQQLLYRDNVPASATYGALLNKSFTHNDHHISEIHSVQDGGMRYVYGLPVYTKAHREANFIVDQSVPANDHNTAFVDVPSGLNVTGIHSEFKSYKTVPEYANSWLLSCVLSPDYVDMTGNGPSDDDMGYWVKFNYKKTQDAYEWRVPYQRASYSEGNKNDPTDDRGAYLYGTKELYYLESVETKTHIAKFITSNREDAISAHSEYAGTGDKGSKKMQKLDKIELYSKKDIVNALKTAVFRYSYKLCPGVPNNTAAGIDVNGASVPHGAHADVNANEGKLTLDTLYFTYEKSSRGRLSPYIFNYGNTSIGSADNPSYDPANVDRWGSFKGNTDNYPGTTNTYPYKDFPYTDQKDYSSNSSPSYWDPVANTQDPRVDAWCMREIYTPTGATVKVEYESDDYAYVQDKPAGQMFDIMGLGGSDNFDTNTQLYVTGGYISSSHRNKTGNRTLAHLKSEENGDYRVYFNLEQPVPSTITTNSDRAKFIEEHYLKGMSKVYFKVYADLLNKNRPEHKDFVSGYADVLKNDNINGIYYCGAVDPNTSGVYDVGYITLKPEPIRGYDFLHNTIATSNIKVHPFMYAAFLHLKANRSEIVYTPVPYSITPLAQLTNLVSSFGVLANDVMEGLFGFNRFALRKQYCSTIDLDGWSVIRLSDPDGFKYGGGVRVKKLTVSDNWINNNASTDGFEYGQKYNYTIEENGETISSGVTYEPQIGGEESTLRYPIEYSLSSLVGSSHNLYIEGPILENYYPSPGIGYRKVTVSSIAPDKAKAESGNANELKNSAAPITVYEFYTSKEFPVKFQETDINPEKPITRSLIIPGIYSSFKRRMARSQGYCLELNDMNGKLKSVSRLTIPSADNPTGTLLSKQEYVYHTTSPFSPFQANYLSNKVQVLEDEATYGTGIIGQTHDIFIDMNENKMSTKGRGIHFNAELSAAGLGLIIPIPQIHNTEVSARTVVTHKIIYRSGIVKKVINTTEGSVIETENLAYDLETGYPLITRVTNEYKAPVYGFSYPAHWYYEAYKGAYQNQNFYVFNPSAPITPAANGRIDLTSWLPGGLTTDHFIPGDELLIGFSNSTEDVYTVVKTHVNGTTSYIDCIDKDGQFISTANSIVLIKMLRPGSRNKQGTMAGSLVAMNMGSNFVPYDPQQSLATERLPGTPYSFSNIVEASATEFSDIWQTECATGGKECGVLFDGLTVINPYAYGIRGAWKPYKTYDFVTTRTQTGDIRTDGIFSTFTAFPWSNPSGKDPKWIERGTITKHSPFGFTVEARDALGRYSASLVEFNNSLVTAKGFNARKNELAFDSFEDYYTASSGCYKDHWGFGSYYSSIVSTHAHTGKYSLKVPSGNVALVTNTLFNTDCETYNETREAERKSAESSSTYIAEPCDCMGQFSPVIGKEYVISAWAKQYDSATQPDYVSAASYNDPEIQVLFLDNNNQAVAPSVTFTTSSTERIVEGWQRINGTFTVPANTVNISVVLKNTSSALEDVFYDDIRIHPSAGNMVTYVYDRTSLRLLAELDDNNFATLYIYDGEGKLTQMKKETAEGIKTVTEERSNLVVKP